MLSNTSLSDSPPTPAHNETSSLQNIYSKFQSFWKRGADTMLSSRSPVASEDAYATPVSSADDLMTMSPPRDTGAHPADATHDLLTGVEFDNTGDVSMRDVSPYDDLYIDANQLDYLVKCAGSTRNVTMDRAKESLFVKFDPLYARHEQGSVHSESVADSVECDIGYETGSAASVLADNQIISPKHCKSTGSIQLFSSKDKPTQVVPPVMNGSSAKPVMYERSTPALVRSVSAILTPSHAGTERLINFGTTPPTAAPRTPRYNETMAQADRVQSLRIILQKQDQEIMQLSRENKSLRSSLQAVEGRYTSTIEDLECKIKKLSDERDHLLDKENKLIQQVNEKVLSNKQMSIVMEEYEKTISSLIGEQQREKIQFQELQDKLIAERDQALEHLSSMECSFNDLLAKYEKCKSVILEAKDREKSLVQQIAEYDAGLNKYESLYNDLKRVTSESLSKANETLEGIKKSHNVELMKMNATIKKHEIKISSLEESLAQKTRDNEELTRICDQLINEVR